MQNLTLHTLLDVVIKTLDVSQRRIKCSEHFKVQKMNEKGKKFTRHIFPRDAFETNNGSDPPPPKKKMFKLKHQVEEVFLQADLLTFSIMTSSTTCIEFVLR